MSKKEDQRVQRAEALADKYTYRQLRTMSLASYKVEDLLAMAEAMTVHERRGTRLAARDAVDDDGLGL